MIAVEMSFKSPRGGWSHKRLEFNDVWHLLNWRKKWLDHYQIDQFNIVEVKDLKLTEVRALNKLRNELNGNEPWEPSASS